MNVETRLGHASRRQRWHPTCPLAALLRASRRGPLTSSHLVVEDMTQVLIKHRNVQQEDVSRPMSPLSVSMRGYLRLVARLALGG